MAGIVADLAMILLNVGQKVYIILAVGKGADFAKINKYDFLAVREVAEISKINI